jgi:hypothetical protein
MHGRHDTVTVIVLLNSVPMHVLHTMPDIHRLCVYMDIMQWKLEQ